MFVLVCKDDDLHNASVIAFYRLVWYRWRHRINQEHSPFCKCVYEVHYLTKHTLVIMCAAWRELSLLYYVINMTHDYTMGKQHHACDEIISHPLCDKCVKVTNVIYHNHNTIRVNWIQWIEVHAVELTGSTTWANSRGGVHPPPPIRGQSST